MLLSQRIRGGEMNKLTLKVQKRIDSMNIFKTNLVLK